MVEKIENDKLEIGLYHLLLTWVYSVITEVGTFDVYKSLGFFKYWFNYRKSAPCNLFSDWVVCIVCKVFME